MTISDGFKHLSAQRGWYKLCKNNGKPLVEGTARSLKRHFKEGSLSEEKMTQLLKSAGYKIIPAECLPPKK